MLLFISKIFIACIALIIIRGTLPRYRIDVFTAKVWKEWVLAWVFMLMFNYMIIAVLF